MQYLDFGQTKVSHPTTVGLPGCICTEYSRGEVPVFAAAFLSLPLPLPLPRVSRYCSFPSSPRQGQDVCPHDPSCIYFKIPSRVSCHLISLYSCRRVHIAFELRGRSRRPLHTGRHRIDRLGDLIISHIAIRVAMGRRGCGILVE